MSKKTALEQVAEFHKKFGLAYSGKPRELNTELALFRIGFMLEELAEYCSASGFMRLGLELEDLIGRIKTNESLIAWRGPKADNNFHDQLDALVDLSYVLHGTAYLQGFNLDGAFEKVHKANMKKIRTERPEDSKRGSKYDVVKPEGWVAPDLSEFLKDALKSN